MAVVLHAGVEGGVDQARLVRKEGHGGRCGAIVGQCGDGELRCAVGTFSLLRAALPVRREAIVGRPFTPVTVSSRRTKEEDDEWKFNKSFVKMTGKNTLG